MNTRRAPAGNLGSLPSNASSGKAGAAAEGTHGVASLGCHCCPLWGWHGRAVSLQDPSLPGSTRDPPAPSPLILCDLGAQEGLGVSPRALLPWSRR